MGRFVVLVLFLQHSCVSTRHVSAQTPDHQAVPVLLDNMDGPETELKLVNPRAGLFILQHSIDPVHAQFGGGSEHVRLTCPAGESAHLAYPIPPAPVIGELRIEARAMCNRPGLRLAAMVVLPRTKNMATGLPYKLLVRGTLNNQSGNWQTLSLSNMSQEVERLARVARAQHGGTIDQRGAYLSHIVILTPGGQGVTELKIDRFAVYGVISTDLVLQSATGSATENVNPSTKHGATNNQDHNNKQPEILRIIQWQSEPFDQLAKLGFDAVAMRRLPTSSESAQAQRSGLSLICPPPNPKQLSEQGLDDKYSAVKIWQIGEQQSVDEIELVKRWQQLLKRHDTNDERPLLIGAQLYIREASRIGDLVLLQRPVLGTNLKLNEYSTWLTGRRRLARPGTPIWTTVETQLSPQSTQQIEALFPGCGNQNSASYPQLVAMTSAAIGAKCSGFYFRSDKSLANQDPYTRQRALSIELTNLHLGLAKPWLTNGKIMPGARSSRPGWSALVLRVERSYLLMPVHWSHSLAADQPFNPVGPASFVVPGVAESSEAYLLTTAGPKRLRHERVTGGTRVSVDELPHDAMILLSDDRRAVAQVTGYIRRHMPRAIRIQRELVALRLQNTLQITQKLGPSITTARTLQEQLGQARRELQQCDQHLAIQNHESAYQFTKSIHVSLDLCEKMLRDAVHPQLPYGLTTLPNQLRLQSILSQPTDRSNRLTGGGFENLSQMLDVGWRHQQLPQEGISTSVRLSPAAPQSGSYCLELEAQPHDKMAPPAVVPAAPVWITTAPVSVKKGELVEITGMARVPTKILGSVDGLQVIDSLGGLEMAHRIQSTPSWQPFRILRVATSDAPISVTLALTGMGTAQVDNLAVHTRSVPIAPTAQTPIRDGKKK